jgi:hypothetical protein
MWRNARKMMKKTIAGMRKKRIKEGRGRTKRQSDKDEDSLTEVGSIQ